MAGRTRADAFLDRTSGVGLVALFVIAGAASFSHIHDLAAAHGEAGWRAWALPVCIDVLTVMAGFEILRDSRAGRSGARAVLPWALLVSGVVASVSANVAQAEPSLTGRLIAAAPALAFMAGSKLVVRRLAHLAEAADAAADEAAASTVTRAGEQPRPSEPVPAPAGAGTAPPPALVAAAQRLADEHHSHHGRPITRDALRARLHVTGEVAARLLAHLRPAP